MAKSFADAAKEASETAANFRQEAISNQLAVHAAENDKIAAAQNKVDKLIAAKEAEEVKTSSNKPAEGPTPSLETNAIYQYYVAEITFAQDELAKVTEAANAAKAKADKAVAEREAEFAKAQADLAAAVAALEAAYNKAIGAGVPASQLTEEGVTQIEKQVAPSTPAGTQSANKKAATNVAPANTATASKALPKTSAVK